MPPRKVGAVDLADLISNHPTLYHMADPENWPGIQSNGLLSTTAILDLFEYETTERHHIEAARRAGIVWVEHPVHGVASIRDNGPVTDAGLLKCLDDGLTPEDWYRILNSKVFFWPTRDRVEGLLDARAYRSSSHLIISVDTASLLDEHFDSVALSPINSGSTIYTPQPRGIGTFQAVADYPWEHYRKKRGRQKAIAEVTVGYGVPNVMRHLVEVSLHRPDGSVEALL